MKPGALLCRFEIAEDAPPALLGKIFDGGVYCDLPCKVDVCFFSLSIGPSVYGTQTLLVQQHFLQHPTDKPKNQRWVAENFYFEALIEDDD